MKTESGLVQDVPCDQRNDRDDDLKRIQVRKHRAQHRNLRQHGDRDAGGYAEHELIGGSAEDAGVDLLGHKFRERHSQNIDHDSADDLIGLKFNAQHGVQQREKHTAEEGKQHRQIERNR